MIRLFLSPEELTSKEIVITGENARHLAVVLRIHPGEKIDIFDGQGYKYECTVEQVHKKEVIARLDRKTPYSAESPVSITLAQGIPKGVKMDLIVQKVTELGASKIIPVITERSQVRHTEKVSRWRKIALEASQQSGRDNVPEIDEPVRFDTFVHSALKEEGSEQFADRGIIFSENKEERSLRKVLTAFGTARQITLLVGPEGGFSAQEVTDAVHNGFIEVSLGPRILRTETAPITAISIMQYELGDLG